jgi:hypothetical protein
MTGSGDGVHVLTGPIFVETAEPGDVLKVEILKLYPRLNPQGETYGVNVSVTADPQCCFSCSALVLWTHEHYALFARRVSLHVFGCVCCVTQKVSGRRVVGIPLWHQRRHGRQSQSPRCVFAGSTGTSMLAWMVCNCFLGGSASSHELESARRDTASLDRVAAKRPVRCRQASHALPPRRHVSCRQSVTCVAALTLYKRVAYGNARYAGSKRAPLAPVCPGDARKQCLCTLLVSRSLQGAIFNGARSDRLSSNDGEVVCHVI